MLYCIAWGSGTRKKLYMLSVGSNFCFSFPEHFNLQLDDCAKAEHLGTGVSCFAFLVISTWLMDSGSRANCSMQKGSEAPLSPS